MGVVRTIEGMRSLARRLGPLGLVLLFGVSLVNVTIPHEVLAAYSGARVLLRPASPGTGLIAGKTVRAVLESAGVRDVLSKSLGSKNAANVAKATLTALQRLRLREDIYRLRGLPLPVRKQPAAVAAPATPPPTA